MLETGVWAGVEASASDHRWKASLPDFQCGYSGASDLGPLWRLDQSHARSESTQILSTDAGLRYVNSGETTKFLSVH